MDPGNTVLEECAIDERLHSQLGVGYLNRRSEAVGTAGQGQKLERLGTSNPIQLELVGIKHKFPINPTVIRGLSDPFNVGDKFLINLCKGKFKKVGFTYEGVGKTYTKTLRIGAESCEMVRVLEDPPERGRRTGRNPASDRSSTVNTRQPKVFAKEKTVIPARTLKFVEVRTQRPVESATIMVEGNEDQHLDVPTAIYQWEGQTGRIAVLNHLDQDFRVDESTVMGYYSFANPKEAVETGEEIKAYQPCKDGVQPEVKPGEQEAQMQEQVIQELGLRTNNLLKSKPAVMKRVIKIVKDRYKVFGEPGASIGKTDLVEFVIDLKPDARPVKQKLRPLNPLQVESLKKQLKEWEDNDCIQPSKSPWASPLVPAWKKGGTIRWAIDYRALNQVTVADAYPVPNIEQNLEKLAGAKVFSALDAAAAYQTIPVEKKSRALLAFITPFGLYEYTRMPFGARNAGSTYSRFVDMLLTRLNSDKVIGYLDDILVFTKTLDEHVDELERVLDMHVMAGIKLRSKKTKLFQDETEYLGFVVNADGIQMNPEYVSKILEWPEPINVKELNTFLGYCSYYRTFIKDYAKLTAGMNQQKKATKLEWTPEMSRDFAKLKEAFGKKPLRSYPRYDLPALFEVTTDFSATAIGGVLSQQQDGEEKFIASAARKTTKFEANYGSVKGELSAVVYCLRKWEHILRYREFVINTDSAALRHLKGLKDPRGIWFRWLSELSTYNFTVRHRKGSLNKNADALSRAEHHEAPTAEEEAEHEEFLCAAREMSKEDAYETIQQVETKNEALRQVHRRGAELSREVLSEKQKQDPVLSQVRAWVEARTKPTKQELRGKDEDLKVFAQHFEKLIVENDLLYYTACVNYVGDNDTVRRVVVPRDYMDNVFYWCHEHETAGHFGEKGTIARAKAKFYYPGMAASLQRMVKACKSCLAKITKVNLKKGIHVPQKSGYPLETIYIDLVGPLPTSHEQYRYLLTVEDAFTRYAEAFPIRNKEAVTVTKELLDRYICRYGMPQRVHSDNGTEFVNAVLEQLMDRLRIDKTTTPSYNPQSNPVERLHRTLNQSMRVFMQRGDINWPHYVPGFLMAYNSKVNSATQVTPHMAFYGREVRLPVDLVLPPPEKQGVNEHVAAMLKRMQYMYDYVRQNNEAIIRRNASGYSAEKFNFKVGDKVLYLSPRKVAGKPAKLVDAWIGPYTVVKKITDVLYRIKPTDYEGPSIAVHGARLVDARQRRLGNKSNIPRTLALDDDGDELGEEIRLPRQHEPVALGLPVQMPLPEYEIVDLQNRRGVETTTQQKRGRPSNKAAQPAQLEQQVIEDNDVPMRDAANEERRPTPPPNRDEGPAQPAANEEPGLQPREIQLPQDPLEEPMEPMPLQPVAGPSGLQLQPQKKRPRNTRQPRRWMDSDLLYSDSDPEEQRYKSARPDDNVVDEPMTGNEEVTPSLLSSGDEAMEGLKNITVAIDRTSIQPTKGTKGSAAVDLYSGQRITIPPTGTVAVPLQLRMAIPEGHCMLILSRSGLAKSGLVAQGGLVDADYRGPLYAILHNQDTTVERKLEKGQRVAQGLFFRTINVEFERKEELEDPGTRHGGFGSTGI